MNKDEKLLSMIKQLQEFAEANGYPIAELMTEEYEYYKNTFNERKKQS